MKNFLDNFGKDTIHPTPMNKRSMNFLSTFYLWVAANVVVTSVLTGMLFIPDISFIQAMLAILIGSAVGAIPLALTGNIGTKTGLPTMVMTRASFGQKGAMLPAIVNSIVLIGWSWIQAYMAGLSLNYAISHMTGYSNIDLFTILTEAAVVLITIYGHRGVERIEKYVSIAMLILSVLVFYKLFSTYNINHLVTLKLTKHPSTTFPVAFDIVVATAFSWMSSVCDFNRHCQGKKGGFIGTYLGYIVASVIAMGLGATVSGFSLMTGVEKTYDPTVLLSHYGFGLIAAIVIFLSVLSTNVMALYSATMSFMNVVPRMAFWKPALMMGIICTIGALLKEFLMNNFYNFILLIGTMFIPVFAIVIVDHYLLKHGRYHAEEIVSNTIGHYVYKHGINYVAYIAYLLGAAFAYYFTYIQPLPTGATLLTFIFSGGLYWGLMALFGQLKVGVVDSQAGYDEQIHA